MHLKQITLAAIVMVSANAGAQNRIGDFVESKSYNDQKRGTERTLQYTPEGNDFVCVNGSNMFTRALYGGYTEYRIETSDRPIFAVFKKRAHRSIRFVATINGKDYPLEKTQYCEARYGSGSRRYTLKDSSWGDGTIGITVVAPVESESAVWQFTSTLKGSVTMTARICEIANTKLKRNGDIGTGDPNSFMPSPDEKGLATATFDVSGTTYFAIKGSEIDSTASQEECAGIFAGTMERNRALSARIHFSTPDPHINTLGGALVMAADGDWDEKTWLHGCIGWRMPLAGWRAGYLGDVLGWNDRAVSHFDAYAASQVTDVPPTIAHPSQDAELNLARAEKKWGTQMYSNGYICRNPERNNQMHHYDMNLNYIDELMWHFCYDADTAYMRKMWPVIKAHLAWEKRNFDPDNDGLYDAYCCIWASDALYYNGGAVTHSTAYNYRGNKMAARIAEIIGDDPAPYKAEAERILSAMNSRLWLDDKGHWAEYQDAMGLRRLHESAAVWSVYTPIDCGAGTPEQFYRATRYVDNHIPHIPVATKDAAYGATISTSNWLPYSWSINNVAAAEVMHTALAFFEAGRSDAGFRLMKANIMDQMYLGSSPGNFGQVSFYDAARGECYRDFGDCIGISSRTLLQGLFGIVPDALHGKCVVRPGFPSEWDSASVSTPYLSYKFTRKDGKDHFEITQNFRQKLKIIVRQNLGNGQYRDTEGTDADTQTIVAETPARAAEPILPASYGESVDPVKYGLAEPTPATFRQADISRHFNSEVDDIFKNKYLSPRPATTTLQIPVQGIGEWCHPKLTAHVDDSVFRTLIADGTFTMAGIPFKTPAAGNNIVYTSLWDNYPDSVEIPVGGKAASAYLLMAGTTNHMQCRIDNGMVVAEYKDGTADTLLLRNPDNWCPIELDYYVDGKAFHTTTPRPYRVCLGSGLVSRTPGDDLGIKSAYIRDLPGGAAQMLRMPLNPKKKLKAFRLRTLSNDVVIGIMGITLADK